LIDNTKIIGQPKWGKNGWIVYVSNDYQINIVKSDGSINKKITSSNRFLYPDWLNDSILIVEFTYNLGAPYYYCRLSINGNIIDTLINKTFTLGSVNSMNEEVYLEYRDNPNVIFKGISQSILTNFSFTGRNRIEGLFWHPNNNEIFWSTYRDGLFKINKNSKTVTKIKEGCDSRSYRYLSISPDGNNIIVERVDATDYYNKTGSWTEEGKIYLLNIDGKNERNIFE
jgi:hypothetical protein